RQGQLDPAEDVTLAHAHPTCRLDQVAVDPVHGEIAVRQDRRNGEDDERGRVVPEEVGRDEQEERDQDQAGQRATEVGHADREEGAAMEVAQDDPERERDREGDAHRRGREADLLQRLVPEQTRVVADEPDRVGKRAPAEAVEDDHAFLHGVIARWTTTSSASATSATRIVSAPAATISVLNTSCVIPMYSG